MLLSKDRVIIFRTIKGFKRQVQRQYSLYIYIIKYNNNTGVIYQEGSIEYINQADNKGIELKLSPIYTYKSNGLIERAEQELILRLIKICESVNLLEKLQPEVVYTAIYLYNCTLLNACLEDNNEMILLDKMLISWFYSYFRWYNLELINRIIINLRLNQKGIYIYRA